MPRKKITLKKRRMGTAIQEFIKGRRPTLLGIKRLMFKIEKMIVEAKNIKEVQEAYKASPEQLVKKGRIPVLFVKGGSAFGCYQQSSILYSALKEMGIRARLTRFIMGGVPHSTVIFTLNGKMYEADPFYGNQVERVDNQRKKYIKEGIRLGKFKFIKPGSYTYSDYKREKKIGRLI